MKQLSCWTPLYQSAFYYFTQTLEKSTEKKIDLVYFGSWYQIFYGLLDPLSLGRGEGMVEELLILWESWMGVAGKVTIGNKYLLKSMLLEVYSNS